MKIWPIFLFALVCLVGAQSATFFAPVWIAAACAFCGAGVVITLWTWISDGLKAARRKQITG